MLFNKPSDDFHKRNNINDEVYLETISNIERDALDDEDMESCINVQSLYFLLAFGWSLAILTLAFEMLFRPKNQTKVTPQEIMESDDDSSEFDFNISWTVERGFSYNLKTKRKF